MKVDTAQVLYLWLKSRQVYDEQSCYPTVILLKTQNEGWMDTMITLCCCMQTVLNYNKIIYVNATLVCMMPVSGLF